MDRHKLRVPAGSRCVPHDLYGWSQGTRLSEHIDISLTAPLKDKDIGEAIFRVINGMDAPFALFAPWLLLRVARAT